MFKVRKRRHDKFKIVFRLQFQATQIANPGTKLMVSLIPEVIGRPTVRLPKAAVGEDGNCKWEDPVYETLKLTKETKSGKVQDKFYHFVVATGSSKKGFVGEILFNFADFVEAVAPVTVWQPISGSNSDAALHVTIQIMQEGEDSRESEENGGLMVETQDRRFGSQLSSSTIDRNSDHDSTEDDYWNNILFRDDDKSRTNLNEQTSFNSQSDQTLALDHQRNSSINSRQDMGMYLESSSSEPSPSSNSYRRIMPKNPEDKVTRKRQTLLDASPEHLKKEILSLERQVDVMDLELQTLRRQVVKETKRGQELVRQVSSLKEEKDVLRVKCEKKSLGKNAMGHQDGQDSTDQLGEVEEELAHAKNVNKMLRRQLGKTQDSNSELILVVRDLEERLDKKEKELAQLSSQFRKSKKSDELQFLNRDSPYKKGIRENNQGVPEESNAHGSRTEEVKLLKAKIEDLEEELENQMEGRKELHEKVSRTLQDYEVLSQKIVDITLKFEDARRQVVEKENQCNCYLRAIEELESEITKMERVMETPAEEFSESSYTIQSLETQKKNLEIELLNKTRDYEDNLKEIMNEKIEQEERALRLEEQLRKAAANHAAAAQRVQEEFQNLSIELASKFDENEKLTMQAQTEASELRLQVNALEEQLITAHEDFRTVKEDHDIEVEKLSEELMEKDMQLEQLLVKLQEECKVIESAKQKHELKSNTLSKENEALRVEMERLTEENYHLLKQTEELEVMKSSMEETKTLLESAKKEEDLEEKCASVRMEEEELAEELASIRSSSEKKNKMIENFQSEHKQLRAQHDELKNQLSEEKLQNANLKKQVILQNEYLQKKDQEMAHMQEKYKNNNEGNRGGPRKKILGWAGADPSTPLGPPLEGNGSKEKVKQHKVTRSAGTAPENGSKAEEKGNTGRKLQPEAIPSQNGTTRGSGKSRKDKKVSDVQSDSEGELRLLLSEVAQLKDRNRSMESDLKEMQEKYSDVSLRFAEVEGERQQLVMTVRNLRNGQKK